MNGYLIVSIDKLEKLSLELGAGAQPLPKTSREAIPHGAVKALKKLKEIAERELTDVEFDFVEQALHNKIASENNGGFRNAGE